jgi:hypothetical protein
MLRIANFEQISKNEGSLGNHTIMKLDEKAYVVLNSLIESYIPK